MIRIQQTCIVGLGALGRQTLEHFKHRLVNTYQDLPSIKLFAIDVVRPIDGNLAGGTATPEPSILDADEIIEWVYPEGSVEQLRENYPWIPDELKSDVGDWTQTRAAARVALHTNLGDWYQALRSRINSLGDVTAIKQMNEKGFEVTAVDQNINEATFILVASIDDIVGGGIGLDIAYLFRKIFEDVGFQIASTGLLFLPPTNQANPEAEARAYAALKELNGFMDPGSVERRPPYRCEYDAPRLIVETKDPPFNRGVFLLDSRNERALALKDSAELAKLTGEWLFRVVLSPLSARVANFATQGGAPLILGQPAQYCSFGLAAYNLPITGLIDYCADRLGRELLAEHLLRPERFDSASSRLQEFMSDAKLRPDDLIEQRLLRDNANKPIKLSAGALARLKEATNSDFIGVIGSVASQLQKQLPEYAKQIDINARRAVPDIGVELERETSEILRVVAASGRFSLATQFVGRVRDEARRSADSMLRKSAVFRGLSSDAGRQLKPIIPALKRAIQSMPSPLALVALVLGGLVAPLAIFSTWLWNGLTALSEPVRAVSIAVLWVASVAAAAYSIWHTVDAVNKLRNSAVTLLIRRFDTELRQAAYEQASGLYPELVLQAELSLAKLGKLSEALHMAARDFRARLRTDPLCGDVDFALQRSVLTPELIDSLYAEALGKAGAGGRVSDLVAKHGTLDRWINYNLEDIARRIKDFGGEVFKPLQDQKLESLLQEGMSTTAGAERRVRELLDNAAPLWSYNQTALGQSAAPPDQILVGLDQTDKSLLRDRFSMVNPATQFESTGDRHSLVVTTLRRGLPLFALNRMNEMRRNYLDVVRRKSMPLHVEDALALSPDLEKVPAFSGERHDAGTVFAIAICLGIIKKREGAKNFVAVDSNDRQMGLPLASEKIESAIFLGIPENRDMLNMANERVRAVIEETGSAAMSEKLKECAESKDTAAWERNRILAYVTVLQS